jgi:hypothetical protein
MFVSVTARMAGEVKWLKLGKLAPDQRFEVHNIYKIFFIGTSFRVFF